MPIKVGLDTSFVLGLVDAQDVWHSQAANLQAFLDGGEHQTYIFDCVLTEVISTLARLPTGSLWRASAKAPART
jgi:predicted nucleic acid-binding protein